jgi:hypothetical protein
MPAILCDHDVEGPLKILLSIWTSADWIELWEMLDCAVYAFAGLHLHTKTPDADIWLLCQSRQLVLLTGNRNAEGDESLEKTIRRLGQPDSLPVITFADAKRVMIDRSYAERVAGQLLEIVYELEQVRGTRRLFVP